MWELLTCETSHQSEILHSLIFNIIGGSFFFHFHTVFGKIGRNYWLVLPPLWLAPPPLGNFGSATESSFMYFSLTCQKLLSLECLTKR